MTLLLDVFLGSRRRPDPPRPAVSGLGRGAYGCTSSARRVERRASRRGLWTTVLVLGVGLITTFAVWRLVALDARHDAERVFDALVQNAGAELRDALADYRQLLRGGAAFFNSIGDVSRETWRTYVGTLEMQQRYPGLQGVGFAAALRPAEIAAHVAQV